LARPLLNRLRAEIYRIGAPVSFYLWSDFVAGRVPRARLYLFLNIFRTDAATCEKVRLRLEASGGAWGIWFYAPGHIWGETPDPEGPEKLTGLPIRPMDSPEPARIAAAQPDWPEPVGWDAAFEPMFTLEEERGIEILGNYITSDRPAIARKPQRGWHSVFVGAPYVSAAFLREAARRAGVHIYSDAGDVVEASTGFVSISCRTPGTRVIDLPQAANVIQWFGPRNGTPTDSLEITLHAGETRYLILAPAEWEID
jgi:hypothetical protein